jgi:hypothetical protein
MDSSESLSDWTIEINGRDVYHVHKSFLAAGKRSSVYFERLFQSSMAETSRSASKIDLESSAAHAVPAMLDFMYYQTEEVKTTTFTAVALRYLANYFEIEELFDSVNRYIQSDLKPSTALTYLVEATAYNDCKVSEAAGRLCAECFAELQEEELLQLSPAALQKIVSEPCFAGDSYLLSRLVARLCESHPNMDVQLLEKLSTFTLLPTVDPKVALSLLESATNRKTEVATLRNRTIKAASEQWQELAKSFDDKVEYDHYSSLSDEVKVRLLEKSLCQARADVLLLEEEKKELRRELKEKNRDLKRRQRLVDEAISTTKEELTREFEAAAAKASASKDALIAVLRQQVSEAKKRQMKGTNINNTNDNAKAIV